MNSAFLIPKLTSLCPVFHLLFLVWLVAASSGAPWPFDHLRSQQVTAQSYSWTPIVWYLVLIHWLRGKIAVQFSGPSALYSSLHLELAISPHASGSTTGTTLIFLKTATFRCSVGPASILIAKFRVSRFTFRLLLSGSNIQAGLGQLKWMWN